MRQETDLLSMQQAAKVLGVTMPTFYAIVDKRNELTPAKIEQLGRQRRRYFRWSDVEALRNRRKADQQ